MTKIIIKDSTFMLFLSFIYFAIGNLSRMLQLIGLPREVIYALFLAMLVLYFIKRFRYLDFFDGLFILLTSFLIITGTIRNGEYIELAANRYAPIIIFLPAYPFFRLTESDRLEEGFVSAGIFSAVYLSVYWVIFVRNSDATYSMSYAYWVAFPIIVFYDRYSATKKKLFLIGMVFMFITLFFSGSRGALLLCLVCLVYLFIIKYLTTNINIKKIAGAIVAVSIFCIAYINLGAILNYLGQYSASSRNIRKIIEGGFLESKSRDMIYNYCITRIADNPWGYGVLASRRLLYGHNYPHSLWYEFQLDFGKYLGIVLFVIVVLMTVSNLFRYRKSKLNCLVAYISIMGIGSLMVSSSYLYDYAVPATIALFVNSIKNHRVLDMEHYLR